MGEIGVGGGSGVVDGSEPVRGMWISQACSASVILCHQGTLRLEEMRVEAEERRIRLVSRERMV